MRLILVTYDYSPNNGGIARLCNEIVKQCVITRTDFLVVTNVDGPKEDKVERILGRRGVVEFKILRFLKKNRLEGDFVLTSLFHPDGLIGLLSGIPTCYLAHGAELMEGEGFFRRHIWSRYRRFVLSKAKCVIANSHYTCNLVKKSSPNANVIALPLAVDNDYFYPTKNKFDDGTLHLCSISRLEQFKGHDFIIDTIARLPDNYKKKIRLTIGGKGPYKEQLEQMSFKQGLQEIIHFAGFISDDQLRDFYSENDVFILCTREDHSSNHVEGFGLVFTEAQACGTPCIGTRTGGIPDAIDEGNGGWLIEQDDQKALSGLLISLMENRGLLKRQSEMALKRVNTTCNWNIYFKNLLNILSKI